MKGWPYRRPLVGNTCEEDAPVTFSRCSPSSSAFHETPHVVATCVPSSPGRFLSAFSASHAAAQPIAPQPMMPLRYVHLSIPSVSSMAASDGSFSCRTPAPSCHVVDAVMDYLDTLDSTSTLTLASGCAASYDMTARHLCELEAVVEGLDLEG
jgi:hypothetical protein